MELATVVVVVLVVVTTLWAYCKTRLSYWTARGVPTAPGALPFLGHSTKLFSRTRSKWLYLDEVYRLHGGSRFCGMFEKHQPMLLVGEPEMVKAVLVKDFDHFSDRRNVELKSDRDLIFNELLNRLKGDQWKAARAMLSPIFTSGKLKGLYPLVEAKAEDLVTYIRRIMKQNSNVLLRRTFGFFTLEVIASCAFGMETNSFADDGSVFATMVEKMFRPSATDIARLMLYRLAPGLFSLFKISLIQPEMEFFKAAVQEAMRRRGEGERRGDFLDLMMAIKKEQNNSTSKTSEFIMKESTIVATAVLFILAGYDTTATTLSFAACQLAAHPGHQRRIRRELQNIVKEHGSLTYQALVEAQLLDAAISETLRLFPPSVFVERQCTKDYRLPGTAVTVAAGTMVSVPVWSLHHDPHYWTDPDTFLPDRFLPENKDKILSGTYLPFGLGPRNCIGMRLGLMEVKLALAKVLLQFEVSRVPDSEKEQQSISTVEAMRPLADLGLAFTPLTTEW